MQRKKSRSTVSKSDKEDSNSLFTGWDFFQVPYFEMITNWVYSGEITKEEDLKKIFTSGALRMARKHFMLVSVEDKIYLITPIGEDFARLSRESPTSTRALFLKIMCNKWEETGIVLRKLASFNWMDPETMVDQFKTSQKERLKTVIDDVFNRYLRIMKHRGNLRQLDVDAYGVYQSLHPNDIPSLEEDWPIPSLSEFRDALMKIFTESKAEQFVKLSQLRHRTLEKLTDSLGNYGHGHIRKLERIFETFFQILVESNPSLRPTMAPGGQNVRILANLKLPGE